MKISKIVFLTLSYNFRLKSFRKANITKSCGISAYTVFQFLLILIFQDKNLFRFLNSKCKYLVVSKNTYYRFLNNTSFNWIRFILLLSAKVPHIFCTLIRLKQVKVFEDFLVKHNRSKTVGLLTWIYGYVEHKYQKGFNMFTLGWSDSYSFISVGFHLLSFAKKSNHYQEIFDKIDHQTNGYKTRGKNLLAKLEAVILLIQRVLATDIQADYNIKISNKYKILYIFIILISKSLVI